MQQKLKNFS